VFAVSLARNAPGCKAALVQTAVLVALQGKTNSAKSATAPTQKELSSVLNAASSHVKPPSKAPSATVTASIFRANHKSLVLSLPLQN
jgi:hypothetical protein